MDLSLTESQQLLQRAARAFLTEASPPSLVKAMMTDPRGYSPDLWRGMVDQGWAGLLVPDALGGVGGTVLDACVLFEEVGRALAPAPLFTSGVLGALVVRHCASADQQRALLPAIADGSRIVALAYTEPSATWDPSGVAATATLDGDAYALRGTKLFIHDAHIADPLLVVARLDGALRVFPVHPTQDGVTLTALKTIAGDRQFAVTLDGARVPVEDVFPGGEAELEAAFAPATVIKAAEMLGSAQRALELAVEYAKQRVAFGRPIGSFQAIQHKCAVMVTDVDSLRMLVYEAAWRLDEGLPTAVEIPMVKDFANEVYRTTTTEAHLIFAGLAYTMDHDLHLHFRRVKPSEAMLGDSRFHQARLAAALSL